MNTELIKIWSPVISRTLYDSGELGRTVKHHTLIERCKFEITREELMEALSQVNEIEYDKHKIFLGVLAIRNEGLKFPDQEWFSGILSSKNIPRHKDMTFTDICFYEKERTIRFIRELRRMERKKPKHNLW